jgi:hypothetical protein
MSTVGRTRTAIVAAATILIAGAAIAGDALELNSGGADDATPRQSVPLVDAREDLFTVFILRS